MIREEDACTFELSRIFRYKPNLAKALVEHFGDAESLFKLSRGQLEEVFGPHCSLQSAIAEADLEKAHRELREILDKGYRYLTITDPDYPDSLSICEDAPVGLFVDSEDSFRSIFGRKRISVVGTRDISPYGMEWCRKTVYALATTAERPSIVSGLAFGTDITAHISAIEAGLPTIAVLGTGIGRVYPQQHTVYAERIRKLPGSAVLSEYPPDAGVSALNFLSRNRIIAGLSEATVLVESRIKGGGMTTARLASSYGRDVFAVPGRNDDLRSQGCNVLIGRHTAEPLIDTGAFISYLGLKTQKAGKAHPDDTEKYLNGLSARGCCDVEGIRRILLAIRSERGITVSGLAESTGMSMSSVLSATGMLESDGMVTLDLLQRCFPAK